MSFHPRTPQSPSQLSPNGTEPFSGMASFVPSTSSTLPTPAHSINDTMAADGPAADESPQKRKRPLDDDGDRDQKKVHIEDRRLGIDALHENVGDKYLLCRTQHSQALPSISEDLFEVFNLTSIAASVARTLPNGEKNAIRKTYKGHMRKLGVIGHFDAVKRDESDPSHFWRLVTDESYLAFQDNVIRGKETLQAIPDGLLEKLPRAMTMAKGPIPKSEWDSSVLGDLAPDKLSAGKSPFSSKGTAPNTPLHPAVSRPKGQQPPLAQEAARPRRSVKRRGYGESSFEGYGEGFPDDDGTLDGGYSTGEGDERGPAGQRRRKKNPPGPTQFAAGPVRQSSYGPGMVGA